MSAKELINPTEDEGIEDEQITSDDTSDNDNIKPYDPDLIIVDYKPFPIFQVMRKIKQGQINLHPEFQRHFVWDQTRQSRLIESVLIRIPLPAFYLDVASTTKWSVIDGLQRLSTLDRFCNKNELRLKNLEFLTEQKDKTFEELPLSLQTRIEDTHLNLYLIDPRTPIDVKFNIFRRINTGGLVLTAQEIRHSLFQGVATKFLNDLAKSEEFKKATANPALAKRMNDRECVLRFLAFFLTSYTEYRSPLDGFLSEAMLAINKIDEQTLAGLRKTFLEAMRKAADVFDNYAFRKMYAKNGRKYPFNKSLFEVWSVCLAKHDFEKLHVCKGEIVQEFVNLMNNDNDAEFAKAISFGTGSSTSVNKRFSTIENLLKRVVK